MTKNNKKSIISTANVGDLVLDGFLPGGNKIGIITLKTTRVISIDWIRFMLDVDDYKSFVFEMRKETLALPHAKRIFEHNYILLLKRFHHITTFNITLKNLLGDDSFMPIVTEKRPLCGKKKKR